MPEEFKKRQTAYKISIGLLLNNVEAIHFDENNRFKFLELNGRDIYRINLIANVIDKFESNQKPYANITLDDGTGNIRVKAFADSVKILQNLQLGDSVLLIGVLRYYNDELYVMPEIVKVLEPKWLVARKLELENEYGEMYKKSKFQENVPEESNEIIEQGIVKQENQDISDFIKVPEKVETEVIKEETSEIKIREPNVRDKIFELIKSADSEGGLDIDKIIMALKEPVDQINKEVTVLLEEGSVYEPKPGRLRVL
jgi:RPA family protein